MQVVDCFECDVEWDGAVCGVEVEDVNGVCPKLFEGEVDLGGVSDELTFARPKTGVGMNVPSPSDSRRYGYLVVPGIAW